MVSNQDPYRIPANPSEIDVRKMAEALSKSVEEAFSIPKPLIEGYPMGRIEDLMVPRDVDIRVVEDPLSPQGLVIMGPTAQAEKIAQQDRVIQDLADQLVELRNEIAVLKAYVAIDKPLTPKRSV
jgi:hypothetical protein